ncbi:ABC transporter permease [Cohnella fermenti]|uniref:ABC transporter permease n=1 Tax=Cohnella fermenti TaxID=2565925 RepID=A0A4S4BLV5_9BACL|nr:ABC transporter permease [Cohnella fermenti]THF75753.1 ABC transporter permease [Cohnella fermenti]
MNNGTRRLFAGGRPLLLRAGRKLAQYVLVIFVALTLNFALPRLAPGDSLSFAIGEALAQEMTPEQRAQAMKEVGLDGSLLAQYGKFLKGALTLDLGHSTKFGEPVAEVLADRLPWTLRIVLPSLILSASIAVGLGAYAAWNRGRKRDLFLLAGVLTLESMPGFWLGMILIAVFGVKLGWFPTYGAAPLFSTGGWSYAVAVMQRMVLPVSTITLVSLGSYFLLTRSAMLDSLGQDYMMMAEAKGLGTRKRMWHALRNALLPVYTHMTMSLSLLVSGAVVVETVFSYPGVGSLLYESVLARDYPLMQGVFLLITLAVIAGNLLADLTYPLVDPRVRIRKPLEGSR